MSDCEGVNTEELTVLCAVERAKVVIASALGMSHADAGRELTRVARRHRMRVTDLAFGVNHARSGVAEVPLRTRRIIARRWPGLLATSQGSRKVGAKRHLLSRLPPKGVV